MEFGTKVVLADAHAMVRTGLKLVLQETERMRVVGETDCVEEAAGMSRRLSPDILVIDLALLRGGGLRAIRRLKTREPGTNVLVLTDSEHRESLDPIIKAGVRGCIGKDRTARELVIAVDLVAAGGIWICRRLDRRAGPAFSTPKVHRPATHHTLRGMTHRETRFKLTLHYDGAAFRGWQLQPGAATVQGAVEEALSRLTGERRTVLGAGRTDTGVHATGQVASVALPPSWTAAELARALNAVLPGAIWVRDVEPVPDGFHPRYRAVSRSYEYRIGTAARAASPFHRRWCWPLCRPLDLDAANRAARLLPGEHAFRAFAKSGQPQRGHVCRVSSAGWRPWKDLGVMFEISANRFLHRMVRYLVGTMVDIARRRRGEEEMAVLLSGNSELRTSRPAPPQGLFLTRVEYAADPVGAPAGAFSDPGRGSRGPVDGPAPNVRRTP